MPLTKEEKIRLIEAYEPILYFHPDEQDVPVRPETYMQASALWCTQPAGSESRHNKENWNQCQDDPGFPRDPLIPKGGISVDPADDLEGAGDPDGDGVPEWYLGHQSRDGFLPYLVSNDDRMLWLDSAAWQDATGVTAASLNLEIHLDRARAPWQPGAPLRDAVDWYYAEVEDLDTLTGLLETLRDGNGVNLREALSEALGQAWFIWYYFLYPVHEENFRDCEEIRDSGSHGSYEGDWNAVGIIVRRPIRLPGLPGGEFPEPEWVGFGQRARGVVENFVPIFRQQMEVRRWSLGEVRREGNHPKVFVAHSSHNNYPTPGPRNPPALADGLCGAVEGAEEEISERLDELEDKVDTARDILVTIAKVGGGCGIGAIIGGPIGCAIGAIVGGIAAGIEAALSGDDDDSDSVDDGVRDELEDDQAPDEGDYGLILAPNSLVGTLPDASLATEVRPWAAAPENHLLDRETQIWWPSQDDIPGYNGRWGVMCQMDPRDRRSGIVFPNFKRAFLLDLAARLSS